MRTTRLGLLGLVAAFSVFSGCSCSKTPTKTSTGSTGGASGSGSSAATSSGSGAGSTTSSTSASTSSASSTTAASSTGATGSSGASSSSGSGSTASTGSGSTSGATSSGSGSSTGSTSLDAGLLAYCEGTGAPVAVGDSLVDGGQSATCAGNLAQRTFRFALCTCDALNVQQHLITDSFLYIDGGLVEPRNNGAVGVDNGLHTGVPNSSSQNAQFSVGGSLFVSDGGITFDVASDVAGQLWSGGPVLGTASSNTNVAIPVTPLINAMYVNGDVNTKLNINGNLVVTDGGTVNLASINFVQGGLLYTPVEVPAPCNCDNPLDIAGIVTTHATNNDNAEIGLVSDGGFGDAGLDPTLFASGTGPANFTFPCGRYYLTHTDGGTNAVDLEQGTTWDIAGRTALLVDGDFTLGPTSGLSVTFEPGAELDIFINGNLSFGHVTTIGTQQDSQNIRWYVGGAGTITIQQNPVTFNGNLYAPASTVDVEANLTVYGALFCKDLVNNANVNIHYGENILAAGQECTNPSTSSSSGSTGSTGSSGSTGTTSTSGTTSSTTTTGSGSTSGTTGTTSSTSGTTGTTGTVDAGPQCTSCTDCNNQACVNGQCGGCTSDAQCCSPLVCDLTSGSCVPLFQ